MEAMACSFMLSAPRPSSMLPRSMRHTRSAHESVTLKPPEPPPPELQREGCCARAALESPSGVASCCGAEGSAVCCAGAAGDTTAARHSCHFPSYYTSYQGACYLNECGLSRSRS